MEGAAYSCAKSAPDSVRQGTMVISCRMAAQITEGVNDDEARRARRDGVRPYGQTPDGAGCREAVGERSRSKDAQTPARTARHGSGRRYANPDGAAQAGWYLRARAARGSTARPAPPKLTASFPQALTACSARLAVPRKERVRGARWRLRTALGRSRMSVPR